jgi:hypothetical protein
LKNAARAKSKAENNITPLGYTSKRKQKLVYKGDKDINIKEIYSSEDEFKETSRFGDKKFKDRIINDSNEVQKSINKVMMHQINDERNDFSDLSDQNMRQIMEDQIQDETISLSVITKPKNEKKNKHTKLNSIKESKYAVLEKMNNSALNKGDFSNISKIDRHNISGLSQSYDIFAGNNITPIPAVRENSSLSNNRYMLKQGVSKSDLSASFLRDKIDKSHSVIKNPYGNDYAAPNFGVSYPKANPNSIHQFNISNQSSNIRNNKVSRSHSDMSMKDRSSISRIFQPSPGKLHDISN